MDQFEELENRCIEFGVRIVKLAKSSNEGDAIEYHLAIQVLRSGTAPAAHYAEAKSAESKADFLHKMRLATKETNETVNWLNIIGSSEIVSMESLSGLIDEGIQLKKIFGASITTARKSD